MVYEEINKLSAFKCGVVQKQYIVFLLPNVGVIETGSYLPTYRSKAQNMRDEKLHCVERVSNDDYELNTYESSRITRERQETQNNSD